MCSASQLYVITEQKILLPNEDDEADKSVADLEGGITARTAVILSDQGAS